MQKRKEQLKTQNKQRGQTEYGQWGSRAARELAPRVKWTRGLREGICGNHCCKVWCSVNCIWQCTSHWWLWREPSLWNGEDKNLTAGVSGEKCWKNGCRQPNLKLSPHWPAGLWTDAQREAKPGGSSFLWCFKSAFKLGKRKETWEGKGKTK